MACAQCNPIKKVEAQAYPINYTELQNYFVQTNIVPTKKVQKIIIDNEQHFKSVLGAAAVMGRNGQPTPVNFKTQYVLAIVLPETDRETQVIPAEISQTGNTVIVNYRVKKGKKMSYTMVPFTAVAIDKPDVDSQIEFYFNQL